MGRVTLAFMFLITPQPTVVPTLPVWKSSEFQKIYRVW